MLATIILQCAIQAAGSAAGASQVISLGTANPPAASFAYQPQNIVGQVTVSSATLNSAIQAAFVAAGGSLS